jgi:hypothetical protein
MILSRGLTGSCYAQRALKVSSTSVHDVYGIDIIGSAEQALRVARSGCLKSSTRYGPGIRMESRVCGMGICKLQPTCDLSCHVPRLFVKSDRYIMYDSLLPIK